MFLELHMLQNFAPANLNRDDTGTPKDVEFGGHRRARISSQCLKRAIRMAFKGQLQPDDLAQRTKLLIREVVKRLAERGHTDSEQAQKAVAALLDSQKLSSDADGKTQYLLFLGEREIAAIAELCHTHWKALTAPAAPAPNTSSAPTKPGKTAKTVNSKDAKKEKAAAIPVEIKNALANVLDGGRAADLALFGRMLADVPEKNREAACQVAHAISTNRVEMAFDFYTAVDDLQPKADTGAGMMGTVGFNSSCFYRYAAIDIKKLIANVQGDVNLAKSTVKAFIKASATAIPTGKQNSFAAHNLPDFVFVVVRKGGPLVSMANAFEKPVRAKSGSGLMAASIEEFDKYWGKLSDAYGFAEKAQKFLLTTSDTTCKRLGATTAASLEELIHAGVAAAFSPEAKS